MKTSSRTALVLGSVIGLALTGTAWAASGNGGGVNPESPTTPEPSVYLMAGIGIVLVGGYIAWRRNRAVQQAK